MAILLVVIVLHFFVFPGYMENKLAIHVLSKCILCSFSGQLNLIESCATQSRTVQEAEKFLNNNINCCDTYLKLL
jgi:hypothetical protein